MGRGLGGSIPAIILIDIAKISAQLILYLPSIVMMNLIKYEVNLSFENVQREHDLVST